MGGDSHCSALGSQGCLRFSDVYFAFRRVINHFANDLTKNDSKSVFVDGPIVIGGYDETIHTEPIQSECQNRPLVFECGGMHIGSVYNILSPLE